MLVVLLEAMTTTQDVEDVDALPVIHS